jgi:hypothetical protein
MVRGMGHRKARRGTGNGVRGWGQQRGQRGNRAFQARNSSTGNGEPVNQMWAWSGVSGTTGHVNKGNGLPTGSRHWDHQLGLPWLTPPTTNGTYRGTREFAHQSGPGVVGTGNQQPPKVAHQQLGNSNVPTTRATPPGEQTTPPRIAHHRVTNRGPPKRSAWGPVTSSPSHQPGTNERECRKGE